MDTVYSIHISIFGTTMSSSLINNQINNFSSITPLGRSDVLAESIVQQIMNLIITNVLQPDDQLPEVALAAQFGVSRIPVREALRKLENYGLVYKEAYQPAKVSSMTDDDLESLHMVRLLIEPQAAKNLAINGTAGDLGVISDILNEMELAANHNQKWEMIQLDLKLHTSLITLNNNSLLNEMWSLATIRLHRFLLFKRRRIYPDLKDAVEQHRPLIEAILSRRGEDAEALVRTHLMNVYRVWQEDPTRKIQMKF